MQAGSPSHATRAALIAALGVEGDPPSGPTTLLMVAPPPERIAGVRLIRRLGRGGNGEVYLGHHETLDIEVAVKLLHDVAAHDPLLAEARAVARVQHRNVVRVLNAGHEQGRAYLIMEFVAGGDIAALLRVERCLPWPRAVALAIGAADGLAAAHDAGFVHSDVKPANLLLDEDGEVKVADLGLARPLRHAQGSEVNGTPAYMAPEQRRGALLTTAVDVYALGATLGAMLCGTIPTVDELGDALPSGVPTPIADVVRRMLASDPRERPCDGAAAAAALRAAVAQVEAEPARDAAVARARGRRWAVPGAAVVLAIGVAAVALAGGARGREAWTTPPRAVFIDAHGVRLRLVDDIERRLRAEGLVVVERARIDAVVREQDLVRDGRADRDSAVRAGRLLGGHVAVFLDGDDDVRAAVVAIETGERLATAVITGADAADGAAHLVADAERALPARGHVDRAGDGASSIDLGRRHGVAIGDRFRVLDAGGTPRALATVTACEDARATVVLAGDEVQMPARAERVR